MRKKKKNSYHPIHLSQKPPAPADIDFDALGLKFPQTHDNTFVVKRLGWAPPRSEAPDLPFHVSFKICSILNEIDPSSLSVKF